MTTNRVVKNASWIVACRIIQSLLAFLVGIFTARYLGPSNYGLISYASSLVSFATPIMYLGFNSILVQELVNRPKEEGKTIGTALAMCFGSALLCVMGLTLFSAVVNAGETETTTVCFLYSLLLLFQAIDIIQFWFQAHLISKYLSITMLFAYTIVSLYKIFLLATGKGIYWFAIANSIDGFIIGTSLLCIYKQLNGQKLSFSFIRAKEMLHRSHPFIVSSMMITIFTQTDRVMLKLMIDDAATGYYSAASTCAFISSFVFTAIFDSMRPSILESKKNGTKEVYENKIRSLYSIVVSASVLQCVFFEISAELVVGAAYGPDYYPAIGILRILAFYPIFSYIGMTRSIWILAESQQRYLWIINLFGALSNVVLNGLLIPAIGINGAAIATIVTQAFTNVAMGYIIPAMRRSNVLLRQSMNPHFIVNNAKRLIKEFNLNEKD